LAQFCTIINKTSSTITFLAAIIKILGLKIHKTMYLEIYETAIPHTIYKV